METTNPADGAVPRPGRSTYQVSDIGPPRLRPDLLIKEALLLEGLNSGSEEKVRQALDAGANCHLTLSTDLPPIDDDISASFSAIHLQTIKTFLDVAIENGDVDIARLLFQHGVKFEVYDYNLAHDGKDHCWDNVLVYGAKIGNSELCNLAFEHGADVNCRGADMTTPLTIASEQGFVEIVKILLSKRADVNLLGGSTKEFGKYKTALMRAEAGNHAEVARMLRAARRNSLAGLVGRLFRHGRPVE
jgi:hypothetical protein